MSHSTAAARLLLGALRAPATGRPLSRGFFSASASTLPGLAQRAPQTPWSAQIRWFRKWNSSPTIRRVMTRRYNNNGPKVNNVPQIEAAEPTLTLSQRMRKLSREYGWSAVGVYFLLSALDFPFCFLGVRWLGTEKIGHLEHVVVETFWKVVPWPFTTAEGPTMQAIPSGEGQVQRNDWGVEEAEKANTGEDASIWTQLALAYAIHKSFIFIRVPLTAAVTPKVVRILRGWGWNIGKRQPKIPQAK